MEDRSMKMMLYKAQESLDSRNDDIRNLTVLSLLYNY